MFPEPTEGQCGRGKAGEEQGGGKLVGQELELDHARLINLGFLKCNEKPLKGLKQGSDMCLEDLSLGEPG